MTASPPKFILRAPEKSVMEKIERSAAQCETTEFREIRCPYCKYAACHSYNRDA